MRIALVCGEKSGDALGAGLARSLLELDPGLDIVGVTGEQMRAAGVRSWLGYEGFDVMGFTEVLRNLRSLLRSRDELRAALRRERPDVFVGIDAPDLNMGLGRAVQAGGGKYVQYVCPSFWFWRRGRARFLARHCAKVLALMPFEVGLCRREGIAAEFVGHRLASELRDDGGRRARELLGLATDAKVLALLYGSRRQEIACHESLFRAVGLACRERVPGLEVCSAPLFSGKVAEGLDDDGIRNFPGQARSLLAAADLALVKSGTVTLEASLLGCPQVIAYRLPGLANLMMRCLLVGVKDKTIGLPNLVLGDKLVAEFVNERATVDNMVPALMELLRPARVKALRAGYARVREALVADSDAKAARAVLAVAT